MEVLAVLEGHSERGPGWSVPQGAYREPAAYPSGCSICRRPLERAHREGSQSRATPGRPPSPPACARSCAGGCSSGPQESASCRLFRHREENLIHVCTSSLGEMQRTGGGGGECARCRSALLPKSFKIISNAVSSKIMKFSKFLQHGAFIVHFTNFKQTNVAIATLCAVTSCRTPSSFCQTSLRIHLLTAANPPGPMRYPERSKRTYRN